MHRGAAVLEGKVSGQVTNLGIRGVSKVTVTLKNQNGEVRLSLTNPFGYYAFDSVPVGEYTLSISGKRFPDVSKTAWILQDTNNIINFVVNN